MHVCAAKQFFSFCCSLQFNNSHDNKITVCEEMWKGDTIMYTGFSSLHFKIKWHSVWMSAKRYKFIHGTHVSCGALLVSIFSFSRVPLVSTLSFSWISRICSSSFVVIRSCLAFFLASLAFLRSSFSFCSNNSLKRSSRGSILNPKWRRTSSTNLSFFA